MSNSSRPQSISRPKQQAVKNSVSTLSFNLLFQPWQLQLDSLTSTLTSTSTWQLQLLFSFVPIIDNHNESMECLFTLTHGNCPSCAIQGPCVDIWSGVMNKSQKSCCRRPPFVRFHFIRRFWNHTFTCRPILQIWIYSFKWSWFWLFTTFGAMKIPVRDLSKWKNKGPPVSLSDLKLLQSHTSWSRLYLFEYGQHWFWWSTMAMAMMMNLSRVK